MFAVIDCGTTNTKVYIVDNYNKIIGKGYRKVGVRNTSMTGSKEMLREGVSEAILEAIKDAKLELSDIEFAIASGMITSEIGLMEIPHLIAPVGLEELAENIEIVDGGKVIPLDIPIVFIRGVRNNYGDNAVLQNIRNVDFMRGEETQVIGCIEEYQINQPTNFMVLSSHTKLIHTNNKQKIVASLTTISGQLYEAIMKETMVGKSLIENHDEVSGGHSFEEVASIAAQTVNEAGLDRCLMIPRFMQVLLTTDYKERNLFIDAAIAVDDMKCITEFESQGYFVDRFIILGHANRCQIYSYFLKQKYGEKIKIQTISDKKTLGELTVKGAITIANKYKQFI